jgi:hypothetical protein
VWVVVVVREEVIQQELEEVVGEEDLLMDLPYQ